MRTLPGFIEGTVALDVDVYRTDFNVKNLKVKYQLMAKYQLMWTFTERYSMRTI